MQFIEEVKKRAKQNIKTILLPEAEDVRILQGTEKVLKEGYAKITLIGNEEKIRKIAEENKINIKQSRIIDPTLSSKKEEYKNRLYELRKEKGMTLEAAEGLLKDPVYFGMMMLKDETEEADGLVSGAAHSTADTLRPALQIIKTEPNTKLVSTFFIMCVPDKTYGENGIFLFGDCGLNQNPTSEELSEIAISTGESFKKFIGKDPKIAMLSYSSKGSAKSELTEKVTMATEIAKQKRPDLLIDGELQLDSAIVPEVAKSKVKESEVAGEANVLIFPDLNSGNIGYKLVQRLAKAEAYGPICQGLNKPVNDLSRGCNSDDIAGVIAITAVQAQN